MTGYNALATSAAAVSEATAILALVYEEMRCLPLTGCAEKATWAESLISNWDISFTQATDGRYLLLASENFDHFQPAATAVYKLGHRLAMAKAAAAAALATPALRLAALQEAYAMDAYACHFLSDTFAAGHARTARVDLSNEGIVYGDYYTKWQHDEDNGYGLLMSCASFAPLAFYLYNKKKSLSR